MTYVSNRPDRVRQSECKEKMRGRRLFAVLADRRVGKTKIVVDDFGYLVDEGKVLDALVIAPGGCYKPWPAAVREDMPQSMNVAIFLWESSAARTQRKRIELENFLAHRGPRVLVVNAEALSTVKAARLLCLEYLCQRRLKTYAVVDESVIIKNIDADVSEFVVDQVAPLAKVRRIMTGLITPRSPLDLWNQFKFLDWQILGYPDFTSFRARYARVKQVCMWPNEKLRGTLRSKMGLSEPLAPAALAYRCKVIDPDLNVSGMKPAAMREFLDTSVEVIERDRIPDIVKRFGGWVPTVPIIEGYENVDELNGKIAPYSYRVRLEDCYDMPPSTYSFWDVEWNPEQRRIYEELRKNATAQLESLDHVTATHVVTQMLRLHQVLCGLAVDEDGTEHEVPEKRTEGIMDLLSGYSGKAVIWCSYHHSIEKVRRTLAKEYGEDSVAAFWGGNVKTREKEETSFRLDPRRRFMVATPDAGRYGREWSVADLVVYYSQRNNLDHRQQSEDRAKAVGKPRPVSYEDMRVQGTVEDRIILCLRNKIDMSTKINGDNWKEWLI